MNCQTARPVNKIAEALYNTETLYGAKLRTVQACNITEGEQIKR